MLPLVRKCRSNRLHPQAKRSLKCAKAATSAGKLMLAAGLAAQIPDAELVGRGLAKPSLEEYLRLYRDTTIRGTNETVAPLSVGSLYRFGLDALHLHLYEFSNSY